MRHTFAIIVLHIIQVLELGFRDECVALTSIVGLCGAGVQGEDVGLAVLRNVSRASFEKKRDMGGGKNTLVAVCERIL